MDVLIVDDDSTTCDVIRRAFERSSISSHSISHGQAALDYLELLAPEELPRVILLDVRMPVLNGWAFRQRQLEEPQIATIPVIFTSGEIEGDRKRAAELDGHYLPKPFMPSELVALIRHVIQAG